MVGSQPVEKSLGKMHQMYDYSCIFYSKIILAYCKYLAATKRASLCVFHSGLYLTRAKVTSILHLLQCRDAPTKLYASHSFRIGAATTAAEASLLPWLIQTLKRCSSNCFTHQNPGLHPSESTQALGYHDKGHMEPAARTLHFYIYLSVS